MRRLAVPLVGAFASGMAPGLVAAALAFMPVGGVAKSIFVSAAMCGMIAASLAGGFMADRLGRVGAIRLTGMIALFATPFICAPSSVFPLAVAGRFAQGLGLGLFSVLLPLYVAETQSAFRRGRATAFYQFSNTLGGIVAALCGLAIAAWGQSPSTAWGLSPMEWGLSPSVAWRVDILLIFPILLLFVAGSLFLKEGTVPQNLGTDPREMTGTDPKIEGTVPIGRVCLAMVVLALTSATGIGSVMHYSVTMMTEAGLVGARANVADAAMRVCGLLAALVSAAFIDRRGRAFVLKIGTAGAAMALAALGSLFLALRTGSVPAFWGTVPVAGIGVAVLLCTFVAFFSFGPGVCVWVVAAELLPASVRAKGMSFALLGNQAVTAAVASVFLPVASRFGYAPLFFAFALAAAAYFALTRVVSRGGGYMLSTEIRASSDFIVSSDGGLGTRNSTASV